MKALTEPPPAEAACGLLREAFLLAYENLGKIRGNPFLKWLVRSPELKKLDACQKQAASAQSKNKWEAACDLWILAVDDAVQLLKRCREHRLGRVLVRSQTLLQCTSLKLQASKLQKRKAKAPRIENSVASLFDEKWYLQKYPEVANLEIHPWIHYLETGGREGRKPNRYFDGAWYLSRNREVAEAGLNPLVHYFEHGAFENRNPGPSFDGNWYLQQNPDVAALAMNPLVHYLHIGAGEGRLPKPQGIHYHLDTPRDHQTIFDHLEVCGWAFTDQPQNLRVRSKLSNTESWHEVPYGISRPDVYLHNPKCQTPNVGFKASFNPRQSAGNLRITVELFTEKETMLSITRSLMCPGPAGGAAGLHPMVARSFANAGVNGENSIFGWPRS